MRSCPPAGGDDRVVVVGEVPKFLISINQPSITSVIPDLVRDLIKALSGYHVTQKQPGFWVASSDGQAGFIRYHQM